MFNKTPFRNVLAGSRRKKSTIAAVSIAILVIVAAAGFFVYRTVLPSLDKTKVIRAVSSGLKARSRKAVILVTDVSYNERQRKILTTIRFTEYDSRGHALEPKHFRFDGDVIQIQSLVMNFSGINMKGADFLRGKKAYLFWKAFLPKGRTTEQVELTKINSVPRAYKIKGSASAKEEEQIWKKLWGYALDENSSSNVAMKNAKIRAQNKIFIPGTMYTLTIYQDGSLKTETSSLVKK
jgi:hypothetical protein